MSLAEANEIKNNVEALLNHTSEIANLLCSEETSGDLGAHGKAAHAMGLDPSFIRHLVSACTTESLRRRGHVTVTSTSSTELVRATAILAGCAGSMSPEKRFHFLAALYEFLAVNEGA